MNEQQQGLDTLQDIKRMMEKSSRFISLSGLSGIAAGICALVGAWFAHDVIGDGSGHEQRLLDSNLQRTEEITLSSFMGHRLFMIASLTFVSALVLAFLFTWLRSRKDGIPIWGSSSRRLLVNVAIPMVTGGIFLFRLIEAGAVGFIAPGCLIFYGLALVNGSKYTLGEVKWLGYGQILLGIINLWWVGNGLYFWALGFGLLHIIYGALMWWKYERN
jgi:hypothetical protein